MKNPVALTVPRPINLHGSPRDFRYLLLDGRVCLPIEREQWLGQERTPVKTRDLHRRRDAPRWKDDKTLIHNSLDEPSYAVIRSKGIPSAEGKIAPKSSKQGS